MIRLLLYTSFAAVTAYAVWSEIFHPTQPILSIRADLAPQVLKQGAKELTRTIKESFQSMMDSTDNKNSHPISDLDELVEVDELTPPKTYEMDHAERENLKDWETHFRDLADEDYQPRREKISVGKNAQGFEQVMFVNPNGERVMQWYDEEGLAVEELANPKHTVARFYQMETGHVELVKYSDLKETVSMEFGQKQETRHLWFSRNQEGLQVEMFFQFSPERTISSRYYRIGDSDWIACESRSAYCLVPSR